ncbi:helix-turn-helix domain-containing protein [Sorangium cellulosum]|uniref:helix-turn-helix domain-containing protein n=2 Tax=Sorangium TaxID=39643 RepID=UPI000A8F4549|nr:helix-turn-helix domain-containing protein [Sorangium cellulosum]
MNLDKKMLDALAAAALNADDPLDVCEAVKEEMRERVLRAALEAEGWNLNAAARRLKRSTSTVQYALEHTYTVLNVERLGRLASANEQASPAAAAAPKADASRRTVLRGKREMNNTGGFERSRAPGSTRYRTRPRDQEKKQALSTCAVLRGHHPYGHRARWRTGQIQRHCELGLAHNHS